MYNVKRQEKLQNVTDKVDNVRGQIHYRQDNVVYGGLVCKLWRNVHFLWRIFRLFTRIWQVFP